MRKDKILSIQCLRAIAATVVVVFHTQWTLWSYETSYGLRRAWLNVFDPVGDGGYGLGQAGVDIFFIISGLVMALVTFDSFQKKGATLSFLKKRATRIYPPYWFWTLAFVGILIFLPQVFQTRHFVLRDSILSMLLIPFTPDTGNRAPYIDVGWTLYYELYFYVLVALGLYLKRIWFLIFLASWFIYATCLASFSYNPVTNVLRDRIIWEFFAGFVLGVLYRKKYAAAKTNGLSCLILWNRFVRRFCLKTVAL